MGWGLIRGWIGWRWLRRRIKEGTRHVDYDVAVLGRFVRVECEEGAEQEAADVGEDGGATRGDAALLEGVREIPELGVDVGGGFLRGEILAEEGGEVDGVVAEGGGVAGAEGVVSG